MIDTFGCIKNTIKVSAGHYLDLLNPDPSTIDLHSIAAALSKICRFGGHCPKFYTVAEHSWHASVLALNDGMSMDCAKAVFLHDAAEAYCGDIVKPLKVMLPEYSVIESRIEAAIAERYDVDFGAFKDEIRKYDRLMLKAEKCNMWPEDAEEWFGFNGIDSRDVEFFFWGPNQAESNFLDMGQTVGLMR